MPRLRVLGSAALLVGLIALAYAGVLHGGFLWDDNLHVTENPTIVGPLGLKEIWTTARANYFPLVLTVFWAVHAWFGLEPLAYHVVTLGCHAAAAILLWRVLIALFARLPSPRRETGAWLGAALWALHPVQVESVAWICELKNTLSAVFFLAAILSWLRWLEAGRGFSSAADEPSTFAPEPNLRPAAGHRGYFLALAFAGCALLSKPSTVMLPVALVLCGCWRRHRIDRRVLAALAPFFLLSALAAGWTIWEQRFHSGAEGPEWSQTPLERVVIAGRAVWFYLGKLLWPGNLIFIYPRWEAAPTWSALLPAAAAVSALAALAWAAMRAGFRGARGAALFAALYFVALLFPVLGFFNVYFFRYSFVGDHFQYLASMGPLALLAVALAHLPRAPRRLLAAAGVAACAALTWSHARSFRTMESLWVATITRHPECRMAWLNLGDTYSRQNRRDDAIRAYRAALVIAPNDAEGHNDLGCELVLTGAAEEAVAHLERAVALKPRKAEHHSNLGNALRKLGRRREAVAAYERALQLDPNLADAHVNLGAELAETGRVEEAVPHFETAVRLRPANVAARENLARAFLTLRRPAEAIAHFAAALEAAPTSFAAATGLGAAYSLAERWSDSIEPFRRAAGLEPQDAEAQVRLGLALAQCERREEAVAAFESALRLNPNSAEAHYNLGVLLRALGRTGDAVDHLTRAAELRENRR